MLRYLVLKQDLRLCLNTLVLSRFARIYNLSKHTDNFARLLEHVNLLRTFTIFYYQNIIQIGTKFIFCENTRHSFLPAEINGFHMGYTY